MGRSQQGGRSRAAPPATHSHKCRLSRADGEIMGKGGPGAPGWGSHCPGRASTTRQVRYPVWTQPSQMEAHSPPKPLAGQGDIRPKQETPAEQMRAERWCIFGRSCFVCSPLCSCFFPTLLTPPHDSPGHLRPRRFREQP